MLFKYTAYCLFFISSIISFCSAQQSLHGKIYNAKGDEVLVAVTVQNKTNKRFGSSDLGGNYKITASEDDSLIFSSAAYFSDTVIVTFFMLNAGYDISLKPHETTLTTVTVNETNNYELDSLNRREYYKDFYKEPDPSLANKSRSASSDGVGISFSPVTFFSSQEKEKRKLRKRLAYDEEQYYIDYRFSANYVSKLTGLKNDSLKLFMKTYRPAYKFCRKASTQDMFFYINDKMKIFMKRT